MRRLLIGFVLISGAMAARGQEFTREAVVCHDRQGAEAGAAALRAGGNAFDAAVATALALAVTHPAAGNLGGGGFVVGFRADRQEVFTIDFRERAPRSATPTMYLDAEGRPRPGHRDGPRAAGVPGTPRGLERLAREHGSLAWSELVKPAIALARDGFEVSAPLADSLNGQLERAHDPAVPDENPGTRMSRLADHPASVKAFGKPGGSAWKAGDRLVQPDLGATLARLAEGGADEFYNGRTAELIVECMRTGQGEITREDLRAYRAASRPPVRSEFRGHQVYGMGPPSSGGVLTAVMLNILARYDLKSDGPHHPKTVHRTAEAMRRGFFVRAIELGDPDFNPIDLGWLTSKAFADVLAASIDERATPSDRLAAFPIVTAESDQTTHLSVIDGRGNAVALTYTLEESYGSKAVVPGAGFLLNNEMGDFNLIPGRTDSRGRIGTAPNRIAPGKRMLSSMSPTLVLDAGKVVLVTGSPGGRTIPNTVLGVLLNRLEYGQSAREAVRAPRLHQAWFPDEVRLESGWPEEVIGGLRNWGHRVRVGEIQGDAHTLSVGTDGRIEAAPDPRRGTAAAAGR